MVGKWATLYSYSTLDLEGRFPFAMTTAYKSFSTIKQQHYSYHILYYLLAIFSRTPVPQEADYFNSISKKQ